MRRSIGGSLLSFAVLISGCGHSPVTAPVPASTESRSTLPTGSSNLRGPDLLACGTAPGSAACLSLPSNRIRHDSAAAAFARGEMSLASAGIPKFAADHPTWDGRGVLIAILDSGIDPAVPGLSTTTDGSQKVIDVRDFSGEGQVRLGRVARHGDTLVVANHPLLGAGYLASLATSNEMWAGSIVETRLGKAPAADLNGNGTTNDTLIVVVVKSSSGWILLADTNGDGSLADERPVHDYLIGHELFGWHTNKPGLSSARDIVPLHLAANFADSAGVPLLDLIFDTSSHGTHVSGISVGRDMYGVAGFNGVAPGAKIIGLKIADDAHGAVSVSGSMRRALEYAIRFAAERSMPLVVNLSFGVGNEIEGSARIDAIIDSTLAAHPDVVMTVASGNDGPGLSTLGFPGSASRVISVGATMPAVFSGATSLDPHVETVASFSSRGGEFAGPDLVLPGYAYSTVPAYGAGEEQESGTSMASPFAAGLAARLLSAYAAGSRPNAVAIRQALRVSSTVLPSSTAADQGSGLPDLTRAWRWLDGAHDLIPLAVDVGGATGRGAVFLTASGEGASARPLGARVIIRRLDGNAPLTLRVRSDVPWLQVPETITLAGGRGEFTVAVQPGMSNSAGLLSGMIRLEGPDETAGALATVPVMVRIPATLFGPRSPVNVNVNAGSVGRVFIAADTGRGFEVEVGTLSVNERVAVALHEPGGMPFRDDRSMVAGFGDGAGLFDVGAEDVANGLYELDVMAGPLGPSSAKVVIRQAPVRLGAVWAHDTLRVSARNLTATGFPLRIRAGLIGAEQRVSITRSGNAPVRVVIGVPAWAARMVVDTKMARLQWSRFTDFGLSFLDRRGREFEVAPINYATSRAAPELPDSMPGDSVVVLLSPGFADEHDQAAWTVDLSFRFYVSKPYALDGDGSPVRQLAPNASRDDRFVPGALPIQIPPDFAALITLVALEGQDHIWTREIAPTRPNGGPR